MFQIAIFGQKKINVKVGQNHLIFVQAMGDKYFGQETSAPERNSSRTPLAVFIIFPKLEHVNTHYQNA